MRYIQIITAIMLFFLNVAYAQTDSLFLPDPDVNQTKIEDFIENSETEGEFDFNTIFESLEYRLDKPLNLNKATYEDFQEFIEAGIMTDLQVNSFLDYREKAGDLIAVYELQSVPGFDLATIKSLVPYVGLKKSLDDFNVPIHKMFYEGKNMILAKWGQTLERARGFNLEEGSTSRFLGDPNHLSFRFKHSYENRFSFNITAEKDPGEEFFRGSNTKGFDFYSAYVHLKDYKKWLKDFCVGDFSVSFGQGLILYSGFGSGKSASTMDIKRSRRTIKPYASVQETNFMRGVGATFGIGEHLEFTAFASLKNRDANAGLISSLGLETEIAIITSLGEDGRHRTLNEIADRGAVQQESVGGSLRYKTKRWHVALNGLYEQFDNPLIRNPQPYNKFYFNGSSLLNMSVDYSFVLQNFNFFGETATSSNGKIATLNGLLLGLDRKVDLSLLVRHFPKDYQAITPNPFAETSGARNETGIYIGAAFKPTFNWRISAYFDAWRHPWLRFNADGPSSGNDFRARITYYIKRKLEVYVEYKRETKLINSAGNTSSTDFLVESELPFFKIHVANKLNKFLELRNRLYFGYFDNGVERFNGFLVYQDVIYRPMEIPWQFSARFALFDTDEYGIRFYAFENSLLNTFSIPAYYNTGTRFYFNARYKGIRNMTLEARISQTWFFDEEFISNGINRIDGNTRTQIYTQLKYQF